MITSGYRNALLVSTDGGNLPIRGCRTLRSRVKRRFPERREWHGVELGYDEEEGRDQSR